MTTMKHQSHTQASPDSDRRDYFRVQDTVLLRIEPVLQQTDAAQTPSQLLCVYTFLRELKNIEAEALPLARTISEKSRELGAYLRLQSRKLDLLSSQLVNDRVKDFYREQTASLSGNGIGFDQSDAMVVDALFDVHLLLQSQPQAQNTYVTARAKVVTCQQQNERYRIAAEFVQITELDRDTLIRHALHVQAQQRRDERGKDL